MKRLLCILALAVLVGFAFGCDLFETRDPEPPLDTASTFVPPTTPDIVLQNLRSAIAERNVINYLRCLPDSLATSRTLRYLPSVSASAQYPTVFSAWSLSSEKSWFTAITTFIPTTASSSLELRGGMSSVTADSATYQGQYTLILPHGLGGVPESVSGSLQLVLALDRNSFWSIVQWTDLQNGSTPTWSDLKGRFAN